MFDPYRRPTVAVVGAGIAGCTAAAECAFSGFDTTLFDREQRVGGHLNAPGAQKVSRRQHFRTPYLKLTKTDGSPSSLTSHLSAAVEKSGAVFSGGSEVSAAEWNADDGQWEITFTRDGEQHTERFDVLIRATGEPSPWIAVPGREHADADELYLHNGVDVVGLPNTLFVDYHTPDPKFDEKSWAVYEARGDYARRYVRQLEIRGPGAMTVKRDKWRVQPGTVRGLKGALVEFDTDAHEFTRAANHRPQTRRTAPSVAG